MEIPGLNIVEGGQTQPPTVAEIYSVNIEVVVLTDGSKHFNFGGQRTQPTVVMTPDGKQSKVEMLHPVVATNVMIDMLSQIAGKGANTIYAENAAAQGHQGVAQAEKAMGVEMLTPTVHSEALPPEGA